jgi:4-deoxy-L-threo-5-hexosulose-uronate ketol-isomerase
MKLLQMADAVRYPRMTTAELRETFLLEGAFRQGAISLAYVDLDRAVIGGAVPTGAPLTLETRLSCARISSASGASWAC